MIHKRIYFAFGFAPDFGGREFSLVHYIAIKSAKKVNECSVFLYYQYEPKNNVWWEKSKEYCNHIKCDAPNEIFGNVLEHVAYKADVFRLKMLNEFGGIYLDIDTICIKPVDDLLNNTFVMGKEVVNEETLGLCNAVMMSEKNSEFTNLWIEEYRNYDSRWGYMQVRRPYQIFMTHPNSATVLQHDAFFKYNWTAEDLKKVHEEVWEMSNAYVLHLWEQPSYHKYLNKLTIDDIKTKDTTYNVIARKFL